MARHSRYKFSKRNIVLYICAATFAVSLFLFLINLYRDYKGEEHPVQKKELEIISWEDLSGQTGAMSAGEKGDTDEAGILQAPVIMLEYRELYEQNEDLIGWLTIDGTVIDYPVMQCPEDEDFYLTHNFYKEESNNGCLILDNDSRAGEGLQTQNYANGNAPSTNLIIHGHTMRSGEMFGNLRLYEDPDYGMSHSHIYFDSLYESREYELIAVFYSQVFYENEDVFKYYQFFQADTREDFEDWYMNIKQMSLYDTGVTAEYGDEFITLSCCSYQTENGRFVVVGKRIQ